jgi:ArsR family transcriptional regulator
MKSKADTAEEVVAIYKCLCDVNRLRILNLLCLGPLCVCQLEAVLGIGSVRTSQHLAYLKRHGMVVSSVRGTWRIYSLPEDKTSELAANLSCLQDCIFENPLFREDRKRLTVVIGKL